MLDLLRAGCSVADLQQISIGEAEILLEESRSRRAARLKQVRKLSKEGKVMAVYDLSSGVD